MPESRKYRLAIPIALALVSTAVVVSCSSNGPAQVASVPIGGSWTGNVTSPVGGPCNSSTVTATISQSDNLFTADFVLSGGASGTAYGTIDASGDLSGVLSEAYGSCTGSGSFTGSASFSSITLHVPAVTSPTAGCGFCPQSTVNLSR